MAFGVDVENPDPQAVSMTFLAQKGVELPLPVQVVDENFHEVGLGAAERQLSAAVLGAHPKSPTRNIFS
jgi:hypothetical protein